MEFQPLSSFFTYTCLRDKLGIFQRYLLSMNRLKLCVFMCVYECVCAACQSCFRAFSSNFLSVVQIDAMITPDKMVPVFIHHRESVINSNQPQNHNEQLAKTCWNPSDRPADGVEESLQRGWHLYRSEALPAIVTADSSSAGGRSELCLSS